MLDTVHLELQHFDFSLGHMTQAQGMSRLHAHRAPTLSSFLPSSPSSQLTPKPDRLRVFEGYYLSQTAAAVTPTDNKAAKLFSQADRPQQK